MLTSTMKNIKNFDVILSSSTGPILLPVHSASLS